MSENTPGTRPVTGIGKDFYATAAAHGNLPPSLYATPAIFSKPFFSSSGKVGRGGSGARLQIAEWCDTAGEQACGRFSPGTGRLGGTAAARACYQHGA